MAIHESHPYERELASLIDNLCRREGNFSLFADMNSDNLQLSLSNSENDVNPRGLENAFILSPFDPGDLPIIMPVDFHLCGNETLEYLHSLEERKLIEDPKNQTETDKAIHEFNTKHQEIYRQAFQKFHIALSSGKFEKLVLSRPFKLRRTRSLGKFFVELLCHYPHSYRFLVKYRNKFFAGATPEVLLRTHKRSIEVMSLAGTMPVHQSELRPWSDKNKKEQELVTDYIVSSLNPVSEEIYCDTPKTHYAGPVVHLLTMIHAILKPAVPLREVIDILHPTPAVCGLSKDEAFRFILENEGWKRGFYTGYLGLISKHSAQLFVNLRSAVIEGDVACCFGGGGLLKESQFEDEWQETVRKISTLKEYL